MEFLQSSLGVKVLMQFLPESSGLDERRVLVVTLGVHMRVLPHAQLQSHESGCGGCVHFDMCIFHS